MKINKISQIFKEALENADLRCNLFPRKFAYFEYFPRKSEFPGYKTSEKMIMWFTYQTALNAAKAERHECHRKKENT